MKQTLYEKTLTKHSDEKIHEMRMRECENGVIEFSWYEVKEIHKKNGECEDRFYHRYLLLPKSKILELAEKVRR